MPPVSDEAFAQHLQKIGLASVEQIEEAKLLVSAGAAKGKPIALSDALVLQSVISTDQKLLIEKKLRDQQDGKQQVGNYKLIKKLGEGGMGAVYLAQDSLAGRKVALKILPQKFSGDNEFLARFRREAKAAGKLSHANIVSAYSFGEETGTHYYAMEFCEGEPLDALLKRENMLSWDRALDIVAQTARGLQHAHAHGFIHRDIKPANILLTKDGVAKILDLGLSKNISDSEQSFNTQTGAIMGTPHYISPEQARGDKDINGRADIYSLGATLYHLMTGQTPFQGSTALAIINKHLNEQLRNPQDIMPDIPDGVVQVLQKMMTKEPVDRYADCAALLADLELVQQGKMPASYAVDAERSSIAIRGKVRAAGGKKAKRAPRQPAAEIQNTILSGDHRQAQQPRSKTPLLLAGSMVGLIALIGAIMLGGRDAAKRNPSVSENGTAISEKPAEKTQLATAEIMPAFVTGDLFNWKDLANWSVNNPEWKIENGEVVGKQTGSVPAYLFSSRKIPNEFELTYTANLTGKFWLSIESDQQHYDMITHDLDGTINAATFYMPEKNSDTWTTKEYARSSKRYKDGSHQFRLKYEKGVLEVYADGERAIQSSNFQTGKGNGRGIGIFCWDQVVRVSEFKVKDLALSIAPRESLPFPATVPADAATFQGHRYKFYSGRTTCDEATTKCKAMGGHLAYIESREENDFIAHLLDREPTSNGFAIGGSDAAKEGEWRWGNGEAFTFTNWMKNQPNGGIKENFLGINARGEWADVAGDAPLYGFICEWEPVANAQERSAAPAKVLFKADFEKDTAGFTGKIVTDNLPPGRTGALELPPAKDGAEAFLLLNSTRADLSIPVTGNSRLALDVYVEKTNGIMILFAPAAEENFRLNVWNPNGEWQHIDAPIYQFIGMAAWKDKSRARESITPDGKETITRLFLAGGQKGEQPRIRMSHLMIYDPASTMISPPEIFAKLKPAAWCDFEGVFDLTPWGQASFPIEDTTSRGGKRVASANRTQTGFATVQWCPVPRAPIGPSSRLIFSYFLSRRAAELHINVDFLSAARDRVRLPWRRIEPSVGKWITESIPLTGQPAIDYLTNRSAGTSSPGIVPIMVTVSGACPGAELNLRVDNLAIYEGPAGAGEENSWAEKKDSGWQHMSGTFYHGMQAISAPVKAWRFKEAADKLTAMLADKQYAQVTGNLRTQMEWIAALQEYTAQCVKTIAASADPNRLFSLTTQGRPVTGHIEKVNSDSFRFAPEVGASFDVKFSEILPSELPVFANINADVPANARLVALHALLAGKFAMARRYLEIASKGGLDMGLEWDCLADMEKD